MIKHILKDGTTVEDITGHVVKDCPDVYRAIVEIQKGRPPVWDDRGPR